jgi:hypothetical protein
MLLTFTLSELVQARKEREYVYLAEMAVKEMNSRGITAREAIMSVMGTVKVTGTSSDIAEIEIRTSQMR